DLASTFVPIARNDIVPLVGGGAGDEGDYRFGVAHVEDFVRHAGFDVDEIAGFVLQHLFESGSEFVAHFSFDNVKDELEADVNVGCGDGARRNGSDVGR